MKKSDVATLSCILIDLQNTTTELIEVAHQEHLTLTELDRNVRTLSKALAEMLNEQSTT